MKKIAIIMVVVTSLSISGTILAEQKIDDMKGMQMDAKPEAGSKTIHVAKGLVKDVDLTSGTVSVAHEPIKSLNWPAMTMTFKVPDKALFKRLPKGKQVEIEFVQDGKSYIVTKVK